MDDDAQRRRNERLRTLTIRRFRLGEEPSEDISGVTSVEERLAMMWPLALRAWKLSGRPIPSYSRADMPGRVIRRGR